MSHPDNQYVTLATKYRPSKFTELRAQESLNKILNYAVIHDRIAQSYLLTGIRGVGKTSAARIIAKTINCTAPVIENDTIASCTLCTNCQSSHSGNHPDIIEVNAASRTSVDDIRDIISSSEYKPFLGKYKVFIIDEVHMLSRSAFSALLKILEEPPKNVVFILATTDVYKIPLTIISRCQRYDFRRFSITEINQLLIHIASAESLNFELDALTTIAYRADGSARDAITMLDQAINLCMQNQDRIITSLIVNQMLGLVDTRIVIQMLNDIVHQNADAAIAVIQQIYNQCSDIEEVIQTVSDLISYCIKKKTLHNFNSSSYETYQELITPLLCCIELPELTILWQFFHQGLHEIRESHNKLIATEMLIIKAIYAQRFPDVVKVAEQLNNLIGSKSELFPPEYKIEDFLIFLQQQNELSVYYFLLNQVEITQFTNNTCGIAVTESADQNIIQQLSKLLFAWTGHKWNVMLNQQSPISTLKDQLMDQYKSDKDWKLIKDKFPGANIEGIVLKTK